MDNDKDIIHREYGGTYDIAFDFLYDESGVSSIGAIGIINGTNYFLDQQIIVDISPKLTMQYAHEYLMNQTYGDCCINWYLNSETLLKYGLKYDHCTMPNPWNQASGPYSRSVRENFIDPANPPYWVNNEILQALPACYFLASIGLQEGLRKRTNLNSYQLGNFYSLGE